MYCYQYVHCHEHYYFRVNDIAFSARIVCTGNVYRVGGRAPLGPAYLQPGNRRCQRLRRPRSALIGKCGVMHWSHDIRTHTHTKYKPGNYHSSSYIKECHLVYSNQYEETSNSSGKNSQLFVFITWCALTLTFEAHTRFVLQSYRMTKSVGLNILVRGARE